MTIKRKRPPMWPRPAPGDFPLELAVKMGVSAGLGLFVAHLLDLAFPVYVLLAVATVADTRGARSWLLAGYRLIGTIIGIALAIFVVELWSVTPFSAGVVMGAIVLICSGLGQRDSLRLAVIVFAVGITEFRADIDNWAEGRIIATLVGAAVTVVVSAVPLPRRPRRRRHRDDTEDGDSDLPPGSIVGQE
jgi:uncharacterized membrane protein YgaE (UPF0421/DUF939 family)